MKLKNTVIIILIIFTVGAVTWISGQDAKIEGRLPGGSDDRAAAKILVTFIELGSVRCIPCRKMMPIMEEIEKEYGHQVKVVFHDVWTKEGKPYIKKYRVGLIPTQVFLDEKGNEYFRHVGFFPKKKLVEVLKQKGVTEKINKEPGEKND